jgi:hypothetical protein
MQNKKFYLLILLLTIIISFPSICFSEFKTIKERSDKWILFGKSDVGIHYYDKSSIKIVSSKIIKVLTKVRLSKVEKNKVIQERIKNKLSTDGWEELNEQIMLNELDCVNKTYKINKLSDYNYQGTIINDLDFSNTEMEPVIPESINEGLLKITCTNK